MSRVLAAAFCICLAASAAAEDLLEVTIGSHRDARALRESALTPVALTGNVYLALGERAEWKKLVEAGVRIEPVAFDVARPLLAFDRRPPGDARPGYPAVYDRHGFRLVALPNRSALAGPHAADLAPLVRGPVAVRYVPPRPAPQPAAGAMGTIDSLVALISEDSLRSYTERLQAFHRRLTGTDSSAAARDWIAARFLAFGYDSVAIDPFVGEQLWDRVPVPSYNVVACKVGALYPEQEIIIGGHFDAVPDCPGADDNATGTAGTMEIARVLAAGDFPMTLKFIAFDSEESWMWGSYHYADSVAAEGAEIVLMINLDMIAHESNTAGANLYWGADQSYAALWADLAPTYGGIAASLMGGTASDHLPFAENGYDVIFVQERNFSTHYHEPSDSTTHLNFEYMTRMVKVSLATAATVWTLPPPVRITAIREPGDGQSQLVQWRAIHSANIDHYRVYWYPDGSPGNAHNLTLPAGDSSALVTGLTEGVTYVFGVRAYDVQGRTALAVEEVLGRPDSRPAAPPGLAALPISHGVRVWWRHTDHELDFEHYAVYRDGTLAGTTADSVYEDRDPALGTELHRYLVAAVDFDGNLSDTAAAVEARAATLTPGRILAINRDNVAVPGAEVALTGEFLRAALAGAACDYRSDSAYADASSRTRLYDLVSYELVVVAGETFYDNVAFSPAGGGLLDTLAYYLAIGGKLLVFGRFGPSSGNTVVTIPYAATAAAWDDAYSTVFHLAERSVLPLVAGGQVSGDLVGAHPQQAGWPALRWDSLRTAQQEPSIQTPFGICAGSFVTLNSSLPDVLYTYDSGTDDTLTEGKAVAWRYLGADYRYIWFDLPLSFFDEAAAIAAVHRAVNDLTGTATALPPEETLPDGFALTPNYPNPFNPRTTIGYTLPRTVRVKLTVYNLLGQQVRVLVDGEQAGGRHEAVWDGTTGKGRPAASGVYLYRLETPSRCAARKMLLLK